MIDRNLSDLSDLAFEGAMAGYLVALASHALETAVRRSRRPERIAVGADGPDSPALTGDSDGSVRPGRRSLAESLSRSAIIVTIVGFALHIAAIVLRGMAASRGPWGNMYEFTLIITAAAVAGWLVVLWRTGARQLGIFVLTPITALIFLAGTVLYTQSAPLQPVLNSYWLHVHVVAISTSSGVLLLAGLTSVAYLVRLRLDAKAVAGTTGRTDVLGKMPSADRLDRIAYRSAIIAFPFYTFAIIAGALWAEVAWGSYWGWDPKETVSLVTWVVFAGYLHARATAGWRGKPAAWVAVIGLGTVVFNLFFVNMVISGLHSYAGLN